MYLVLVHCKKWFRGFWSAQRPSPHSQLKTSVEVARTDSCSASSCGASTRLPRNGRWMNCLKRQCDPETSKQPVDGRVFLRQMVGGSAHDDTKSLFHQTHVLHRRYTQGCGLGVISCLVHYLVFLCSLIFYLTPCLCKPSMCILNDGECVGNQHFLEKMTAAISSDGKNFISGGEQAQPSLADIDNDGDLDMVVAALGRKNNGNMDSLFHYYKNIGTRYSPMFELQADDANPFFNLSHELPCTTMVLESQLLASKYVRPFVNLLDFDRDGDIDMLVADGCAKFSYFEHYHNGEKSFFVRHDSSSPIGNALERLTLTLREGATAVNPTKKIKFVMATFVDLDFDNDSDIILTYTPEPLDIQTGELTAFKNIGNNSVPDFELWRVLDGTVQGIGAPSLVDWDNDGDKDLLVTSVVKQKPLYYENVGSKWDPVFTVSMYEKAVDNIFTQLYEDLPAWQREALAPAAGDIDDDGDFDLILAMNVNIYIFTMSMLSKQGILQNPVAYTELPCPVLNCSSISADHK